MRSARWLALGVWAVWLALYWRGGVGLVRQARRTHPLDRRLISAIVLFSMGMVFTGLMVCRGYVAPDGWADHVPVALTGAALVSLGALGTFWCRAHLGRFWSAHTTLQPDHRVVDTGPYAVVRHPIYTAASLMTFGTALLFSVWWVWACAVGVALAYMVKARIEERFLLVHLPGYRAYRQRVRWGWIPVLW